MARSKTDRNSIPAAEWIAGAIGLILVSLATGTAVYRALSDDKSPPNLRVEIESITPMHSGYLAKARITNTGSETAAELRIEGRLLAGTEVVETSSATLTYSPANSVRSAGLIFTQDPKLYRLEVRSVGFEAP